MQVPVLDSRGVTVRTCPPIAARHLIQQGQAVPRRDANGSFFVQLVPMADGRRRKTRQPQHHPRPLTRRARLAQRIKYQNYLLSVLADSSCLTYQNEACADGYTASSTLALSSQDAACLDHLLVIDIESTCWPSEPPEGERAEIIEIGVCVVDVQSGARLDKESILIRPERSTLSPFCTQLTSLTPDHVMGGIPFASACARLSERYGASQRPWASYGDYDRRMFEIQCGEWGIPYPFSATHVNVKHLVSLVHGLQYDVGLIDAMRLFELPVEGVHHRGIDDAWNTALIASTLILQRRADLTRIYPDARHDHKYNPESS